MGRSDATDWEDVTFTITATMRGRWARQFLGLLKLMQQNGSVGHSEIVSFYSDGDGDYHPKFEWDDGLPEPAKPSESRGEPFFDARGAVLVAPSGCHASAQITRSWGTA